MTRHLYTALIDTPIYGCIQAAGFSRSSIAVIFVRRWQFSSRSPTRTGQAGLYKKIWITRLPLSLLLNLEDFVDLRQSYYERKLDPWCDCCLTSRCPMSLCVLLLLLQKANSDELVETEVLQELVLQGNERRKVGMRKRERVDGEWWRE